MRYFRAFIYSLIFHIVAALVFWLLADQTAQSFKPKAPTVVELMEAPELPRRPSQPALNEKQFVRQAQVPDELKTNEKRDKRFSSEEEQYVLEERQARASGLTENRSTSKFAEERGQTKPQPQAKSNARNKPLDLKPESSLKRFAENELVGLGDVEQKVEQKKVVENSGQPLDFSKFGSVERGLSTVGEQLPDDVKFGDFTALNTDRHLYYSFYSRIEQMIRPRWVNYARAVVYNLENGTEVVRGRATWTTKLEVILDNKGTFQKALLHEGSGVRSLDSAPVQAFRDAQQFPNPPQEMVKGDGTIHIYYAFSVNIIPRYASVEE
jgi:TonB family protein